MTSRLTEDVILRFVAALRDGESWASAAKTVGVDASTAHRWRRDGDREDGTLRARFAAAVRDARAAAEAAPMTEEELVTALEAQARRGSVRAATFLLERQWPERWTTTRSTPPTELAAEDPFADLDALGPRPIAPADELAVRRGGPRPPAA